MKDILDINDLNDDNLKPVDIGDILPVKQKSTPKGEAENQFLDDIDRASKRYEKQFEEEIEEKQANGGGKSTREQENEKLIKKFENVTTRDILHNKVDEVIEKKGIVLEPEVDIDEEIEKEIIIDDKRDIRSFNTAIDDEKEVQIDSINEDNVSLSDAEEFDDSDFEDIINDEIDFDVPLDLKEEKDDSMKLSEDGNKSSDEDNEEDDEEKKAKETGERLKKDIKNALNPIKNPIDLTTAEVVKKPISANSVLLSRKSKKHVTDWVLMEGKKNFTIEAFSGLELEKLDTRNREGMNTYKLFIRVFREIFDHIINYKDKLKLIEWLKSVSFFDLDHIWFSVYKSSCEKSNILPYTCTDPKCKHSFIKTVPIMDMVKFKDDAAKELFNKILNGSIVSDKDHKYKVKRKQIADDLVIDLREPSIWNILFENALLPDNLRQKYAILLNAISFIDAIYFIDENNNLVQVDYKRYPEDVSKEARSKVYTYGKILSDLSAEEKLIVDEIIKEMAEGHDNVSYIIPEVMCEECGHVIESIPVTGEELVTLHLDLADMTLS